MQRFFPLRVALPRGPLPHSSAPRGLFRAALAFRSRAVLAIVALVALAALAACAPASRPQALGELEADPAWLPVGADAPLPAAGWVRGCAATLHVYIEGDGAAYASRTMPSLDPTPREATGLLLARTDPAPAVAYLGRPCQYVSGPACSPVHWTTGRFSPSALAAQARLLDAAMRAAGARRAVLFGFSGGGAMAALLAAQRADVAGLVTVCGNLDHAVWTRMHAVAPLSGSLNPADVAGRLAALPQVHFLGAEDSNVTRRVTDAFVTRLGPGAPVRVLELPGLGHGGAAWAAAWPGLLSGLAAAP